jgi:hypothetical protein
LDSCQRLAVGRALFTPQLSLIAGGPGTGKSRVLAEIVHQARQRDWRVLLVAASTAGLEAVLRFVPEPRDWISLVPLTTTPDLELGNQARRAQSEAIRAAQQTLAEVCTLQAALATPGEVEARAVALCEEYRRAEEAHAALLQAEQNQDAEVQANWSEHPEWAESRDHFTKLSHALEQRLHQCLEQFQLNEQALEQLHKQRDALASRQQCRQSGHWVSPAWWAALIAGDPGQALSECQRREDELQTLRATLTAEKEALTAEREALEREQTNEAQAFREQLRHRAAEQHARLHHQWQEQRQDWQTRWDTMLPLATLPEAVRSNLVPPAPLEEGVGPQEFEAAVAHWRDQAERLRQTVQSLREMHERWLQAVERHPFEAALRAGAGVMATTANCLPLLPSAGGFDLVLVEEAHRLTDADLLALGDLGTRCTLVGDPAAARQPNRFTHCWQRWFRDSRAHSTAWKRENEQLVAVLHPERNYEADWVSGETVFDHPEVELRIAHPPGGDPFLVEVRFPGSMPLPEALQFLASQGETRICEVDRPNVAWRQHGTEITLEWHAQHSEEAETACPTHPAAGHCLTLEPGVCEHLTAGGSQGWKTASLVFESQAGWTAERVRDWLHDRLGWCPSDRATLLDRSYRTPAIVRFQPVSARGRSGALEIDLREPELLPGPPWLPHEVRAQLPATGLVNPAEACAIVELLAEWLADPVFVAEIERAGDAGTRPPIALLTPYAAQAVLLRGLIQRAEFHPSYGEWLEVSTLEAFAQRECDTAVVSLTRSAPQRIVSYGETGDDLGIALTRATHRLVLLGDPATLARRVQRGESRSIEAHHARQILALCPEAPAEVPARPIRSRESSTV